MSSSLSYDPGGEVSRVLKVGVARRMVLFLVWLSSIRAVGQQLQNDQFRVAFSSAGTRMGSVRAFLVLFHHIAEPGPHVRGLLSDGSIFLVRLPRLACSGTVRARLS